MSVRPFVERRNGKHSQLWTQESLRSWQHGFSIGSFTFPMGPMRIEYDVAHLQPQCLSHLLLAEIDGVRRDSLAVLHGVQRALFAPRGPLCNHDGLVGIVLDYLAYCSADLDHAVGARSWVWPSGGVFSGELD